MLWIFGTTYVQSDSHTFIAYGRLESRRSFCDLPGSKDPPE